MQTQSLHRIITAPWRETHNKIQFLSVKLPPAEVAHFGYSPVRIPEMEQQTNGKKLFGVRFFEHKK